MVLPGSFQSQLQSTYYANLLALVKEQIAAGEYGSGATFDGAAAVALQLQGQDFSTLMIPSAGTRAIADCINTPIDILNCRFNALQSEVSYFQDTCAATVARLSQETGLLDQLLDYTNGSSWAASVPQIGSGSSFFCNFAGGLGLLTTLVPPVDPSTAVASTILPRIAGSLNTTSGSFSRGLVPAASVAQFAAKNLTWIFSTPGQSTASYGTDWADLDILESQPRLVFASQPTVIPSSATSFFTVSGSVPGGILPTYVNVQFLPRGNQATITISGSASSLTAYSVEPEDTTATAAGVSYTYGVDFSVNADGYFTSLTIPNGTVLTVQFTEYFPSYQCSVDMVNWSRSIMLDPNRPYPDDTTEFSFLGVRNGLFPLTDGSGALSGLYLSLASAPTNEMVFTVTTPAASNYGVPVQLQVDMERPAYMTGLNLAPYTGFPQTLTKITCQSVTGAPMVLFSGSVLLEREVTLSFPRTAVRSLTLSFTQENYSLKQYEVQPADLLRRQTLNSLQAILPAQLQATVSVEPQVVQGALYHFGFEKIYGIDDSQKTLPSLLVSGPYRVTGSPDALRFDALLNGTVSTYLFSNSYSSVGALLDQNTSGVTLASGQTVPFPVTNGTNRAGIFYADVFLMFVLRSADACVERFSLQVAHV